MVGPEDEEVEAAIVEDGDGETLPSDDLSIVTINVDGLGRYRDSPIARMEQNLNAVLPVAPEVLLLQEVIMEMYGVVQHRLSDWKVY